MSRTQQKTRGPKKKPAVRSKDVSGRKYLRTIFELLAPLHEYRACANRKLHYDQYVGYELLYFFSPALTSLRGLQQASGLRKLKDDPRLGRFSLGSVSAAGGVFDPQRRIPVIEARHGRLADAPDDPRLAKFERVPTAVDGTLLHALPRMAWALWVSGDRRAAKVHLEFDLLKAAPSKATVTHGNGNERAVLKENLAPGKLYVLDGGYADYGLLAGILYARSSFVCRIRGNATYQVLEERSIAPSAREAGVEKDVIVQLGCQSATALHERRIRLVQIHIPDTTGGRKRTGRTTCRRGHRNQSNERTLLLATDLLDLDADLIALLYRYRWQIELFFRWFKKILGAEHLLSENLNGVTIMVYCAVIASLLVTLWTRRKPTKRTFEMICLYLMGWADEDELAAHIDKLAPAVQ